MLSRASTVEVRGGNAPYGRGVAALQRHRRVSKQQMDHRRRRGLERTWLLLSKAMSDYNEVLNTDSRLAAIAIEVQTVGLT